MKKWLAVAVAVMLAGCATTDPRGAADIRYHLPRTDAKVTLSLTLRSCNPIKVDASTTLSAVVSADEKEYVVSGATLASSRVSRKVRVDLNDDGILTSVNTTSTDKTAQIVGNYIQGIAQIVGAVLLTSEGADATKLTCYSEIAHAVSRAQKIGQEIDQLRQSATPVGEERWKTLKALANELGALDAYLTIDVKGTIVVDRNTLPIEGKPRPIVLQTGPFAKWFDISKAQTEIATKFELSWWATESTPSVSRAATGACKLSLSIPAPTMVTIHVAGRSLVEKVSGDLSFPAAQRGTPRELCLDVGLGEGRTVALTLDTFGRTKIYDWSSDASGEAISAAFAGAAKSAGSLLQVFQGPSDLARKQLEISELEAELKLQDLRACKATRDHGGTCEKP